MNLKNERIAFKPRLALLMFPALWVLTLSPAFSDPPPPGESEWSPSGHCPSGQCRGARQSMFSQLGLSQEQSRQIKEVLHQGREQGRVLIERLRGKQKEMMTYLHSTDAREGPARVMNNDILELQRQLSELRLKTWFAIRAQLTPEQRRKMSQFKPSIPPGNRRPSAGAAPPAKQSP